MGGEVMLGRTRQQKLEEMGDLLTQEEVDNLEEGEKVKIIWSGGNGPAVYKVIKKYGKSHVDTWYEDQIDHVTADRNSTLTHVSRA